MLKEFKEFVSRGNVIDLAVGIIIGAAFGKIVSSFVADILMPVIGLFLGKMDFTKLFLALDLNQYASLEEAKKAAAPVLTYGVFLQTVLDFLIIAFAIFLLVKAANKARPPVAAAPSTKECPQCASQIPLKAKRCPLCTTQLS